MASCSGSFYGSSRPTKDQVLAEYKKIAPTKVDPRYSSKVSSSTCFSSKVSRTCTPTLCRTMRRVNSLRSMSRSAASFYMRWPVDAHRCS